MSAAQHRLPARCQACGELFWLEGTPTPVEVPCPSCEQPLQVPAGRFEGVRNLVLYTLELSPTRLEHLEMSLTWTAERLVTAHVVDEFGAIRRALTALEPAASTFWRQCLLAAIGEMTNPQPGATHDAEAVTAIARSVVQRVMSTRSFEPRPY